MGFTIDIDTGGTFTDGYFTNGSRYETVKVDTTPHDFTVCLLNCIKEGANRFNLPVDDFLHDTDVIRYSQTVGTNLIIQKKGPKLGLIVSKGFETNLYDNGENSDSLDNVRDLLVSPEMIVGINGKLDENGHEVEAVNEEEIKQACNYLVDMGARIIVVSLEAANLSPIHEQKVKEIIYTDYPKHYLGSVPVLLSSEVTSRPNGFLRTTSSLLNAYLHRDMARYLYKASEDVQAMGFDRPLLIAHATGGTARVAKTMAISTYNSGPVAGLMGSMAFAKTYDLENVLTIDIGGTSTDLGIINQSKYEYTFTPEIAKIPNNVPMVKVEAFGGGGGSIAKVNSDGGMQVGPESAGALPGPACYEFGGTNATVTDANLVLGYINPNYFLGGRRKLSQDKAIRTIQKNIADKLNISVEEAAIGIKKEIESSLSQAIGRFVSSKDLDPANFSLFSFGGAGGLHCAAIADHLNVDKVYVFPHSSVFCAYGASTMDVLHIYERAENLTLQSSSYAEAAKKLSNDLNKLRETAYRDMRGEGFASEQVSFILELEMNSGKGLVVNNLAAQYSGTIEEKDIQNICELYKQECSNLYGQAPDGAIKLESIRMKAVCPNTKSNLTKMPMEGADPSKALKGERQIYWDKAGYQTTPIYDGALIKSGNVIEGPCVIETVDTTYLIPEGFKYSMDTYCSGIIEKIKLRGLRNGN